SHVHPSLPGPPLAATTAPVAAPAFLGPGTHLRAYISLCRVCHPWEWGRGALSGISRSQASFGAPLPGGPPWHVRCFQPHASAKERQMPMSVSRSSVGNPETEQGLRTILEELGVPEGEDWT